MSEDKDWKAIAATYKEQRNKLLAFIQHAQVSSNVCCCGDSMDKHASPMACGHSPVDQWDWAVQCSVEEIAKFDSGSTDQIDIADVWHEGSKSFYRAALLEKLTPQQLAQEDEL